MDTKLPFDNTPPKTKKEYNQILSKKAKEYQQLKPFPTTGLWVSLYDMISPHSNTGEKSNYAREYEETYGSFYKDYPIQETIMLMTNDGPKPELIRRPAENELVHIDSLHVTIHKNTFKEIAKLKCVGEYQLATESDYVYAFEVVLKDILGIGVESKLKSPKNYYEETYKLENDCGLICIGGQNDTILLTLNGQGCCNAKYGWEEDLHAWLTMYAVRPKITRIDYAFDDLDGSVISPDWALAQYKIGAFTCGGRPPKFTTAGSWILVDGSGRTAYIGSRKSGKFCRIYEKGKELGDEESLWTRCEVEYKATDFFIPLTALLDATEHFLSAYPCFHVFESQTQPKKFEVFKKETEITINKAVAITKHQFSKYLKFFRDYYGDDTEVLDMLMPDKDKQDQYPKRIKGVLSINAQAFPPEAITA